MPEHKEESKEEVKDVLAQTVTKAEEEIKEPKEKPIDEDLKAAMENGYNPDDPKGYTPREYNLRGPLLNEISERGKELKRQAKQISNLEDMIKRLGDQMSKSEARSIEKEAKEIHLKRLEAIQYGDTAKFEALDKEYQELRASVPPAHNEVAPVEKFSPDAQAFVERNAEWFNTDTTENFEMKKAAIEFEQEYCQARAMEGKPQLTHAVLGRRIEDYIKSKFPHRFENPEKDKPSAVAGSKNSSIDKEVSASMDDLTPHQQQVYQRMKRADPKLTPDKYLESLTVGVFKIEKE